MKRVMMTAFALALLGGTSVLAAPQRDGDRPERAERGDRGGGERGGGDRGGGQRGDGQRGGGEDRQRPQAQERPQAAPQPQAQPQAQPQRAPQQQAQQPQQDRGDRTRFDIGRGQSGGQPSQFQRQPDAQRAQGDAQRAQAQAQTQAQARGQDQGRGQGRPSNDRNGFYDRNGDGRPDGRPGFGQGADRNDRNDRDGRFDGRNGPNGRDGRDGRDGRADNRPGQNGGFNGRNGNDRWDRNGPPRGRPPVVRPQDRYDRDRNRPRYDRNRWSFLIQPRSHYYWRGSTYYAPYDFYPRSWAYGQSLPWNWYTPDYYINDYAWYGLPLPPIGCEWVRLGDDAVLVDIFTGRILSVTYSLFY